jgi:membrane-associated PAP2 superfamily phosphatase
MCVRGQCLGLQRAAQSWHLASQCLKSVLLQKPHEETARQKTVADLWFEKEYTDWIVEYVKVVQNAESKTKKELEVKDKRISSNGGTDLEVKAVAGNKTALALHCRRSCALSGVTVADLIGKCPTASCAKFLYHISPK